MDYDVFISHASEDKDGFVRELATCLRNRGVAVWYDDYALRLGDSLSASISKGLSSSSFGVVVISPHFIAKRWPQRELAALVAREDVAEKVILPIWHDVTKEDLLAHLPLLADKLAAHSSEGANAVAEKILDVVSPKRVAEVKYQQGLEAERNHDPKAATSSYIETLYIDKDHHAASRRLEALLPKTIHPDALVLGRVKWFALQKGFGFVITDN